MLELDDFSVSEFQFAGSACVLSLHLLSKVNSREAAIKVLDFVRTLRTRMHSVRFRCSIDLYEPNQPYTIADATQV